MKLQTKRSRQSDKTKEKQAGWFASFLRITTLTVKLGIIFAVLFTAYANLDMARRADRLLYNSIQDVPPHKVGIVLGTSWASRSGTTNRFFTYRMQAAAALYKAGKIEYILASGDNQYHSYNEPRRMRRELIDLGVPPEHIYLDYAGFSTLDSIYRAKYIFQLEDVLVISQDFQNERAIFLGSAIGMNIHGFNARSVGGYGGIMVGLREYFARSKAFLDVYLLNTQPRFLGDVLSIPGIYRESPDIDYKIQESDDDT
ncbi:SanA/YdcF family protein [Spirochaeta dissipatitropha]